MPFDKGQQKSNRFRGSQPETEEKYRQAVELYRTTELSCAEISRVCEVTVSGLQRYISLYHRDLLLARYNITCSKEDAQHIKFSQLRGQLPTTRAKYKDAVKACGSMDYIEFNVSQVAAVSDWTAQTSAASCAHTIPKSLSGGNRYGSG